MKICKRICAFALAILGVSIYARDAHSRRTKNVEGFVLESDETCVYGGRNNYIKSAIFGKIAASGEKNALSGIKVALYSGIHESACAYTDDDGNFQFGDMFFWAGVGVKYTIIVSDPNGVFEAERRDIEFEIGEISKEESFELKKSDKPKKAKKSKKSSAKKTSN